MQWGASKQDWLTASIDLDLTSELLPIVCNPEKQIGNQSTLSSIGKIPSVINRNGNVVGLANWTKKEATLEDISKYAANSDYGIGCQTRRLNAIDIDLNDSAMVDKLLSVCTKHIKHHFYIRSRKDSVRILIPFFSDEGNRKQVLNFGDERVEWLATGQQFVMAGTHVSGTPYLWHDTSSQVITTVPTNFEFLPFLSSEQAGNLWSELATHADSKSKALTLSNTPRQPDPVYDWIIAEGLALGTGNKGQLYVECPFSYSHTTKTGVSSSAYFPKGTNGYDLGSFVCLHAHCADQHSDDFIKALGYDASLITALPALPNEKEPIIVERNEAGAILATINNITTVLARADLHGMHLCFDSFQGRIMWSRDGTNWSPFEDTHYTEIRLALERNAADPAKTYAFKPISSELLREVVGLLARRNTIDTAKSWLEGLKWDGVPRIETFLSTHYGVPDGDYTRAVARYMWTAVAGRVMEPGCEVHMVPVFVGAQGLAKSRGLKAMSPWTDSYKELNLAETDDNMSRKLKGTLIGEFGELRGMNARDIESIKAMITRSHENFVDKWEKFSHSYARRVVFFGTTNDEYFLQDETGNRRFLPVSVEGYVNVAGISQLRDQLWAEGLVLWTVHGVCYAEAERLARAEHGSYMTEDVWHNDVVAWLQSDDDNGGIVADRPYLTLEMVLSECLGMNRSTRNKAHQMRVARVLKMLGYKVTRAAHDQKRIRVYVKQ